MENGWQSFGDKSSFAFEFRLMNDPDKGQAATRLESASWGEFRFWVQGRNLCQHHHMGQIHQETAWYLSPLLIWLTDNWEPLFHEERFPLPCSKPNARMGYLDSLRRYLGDFDPAVERKGETWFDWWQRHALRSCRQGGLFPDLFFRRLIDFVEISWGNFPIEGVGEDFYFTAPQGSVSLSVGRVAKPLLNGLDTAISQLINKTNHDRDLESLAARVAIIKGPNRLQERLSWYTSIVSHAGEAVKSRIEKIIKPEEESGFISRLSPAVAMFGSLAPEIGESDMECLISRYIDAHDDTGDSDLLRPLIAQNPELPDRNPFDAGYDAALAFLDAISESIPKSGWVDILSICNRLGILVDEVQLNDSNIRGAAFAGDSVRPTILINTAHPNNKENSGKRFSIGHELCHILHDRFFGGEISIASGQWAPVNIEKRANAFSAMLLMPLDLINDKIRALSVPLDTPDGIEILANQLQASRTSLLWHLYNLNKLDESQRAKLDL
ncbi:MAG: ImmA/IrrE family metallo-endopeptidase [Magnetococcales bacterium]|nr:ImmA/IrrE family metallo-endopeptidase [Magnetococcales bacterium]